MFNIDNEYTMSKYEIFHTMDVCRGLLYIESYISIFIFAEKRTLALCIQNILLAEFL